MSVVAPGPEGVQERWRGAAALAALFAGGLASPSPTGPQGAAAAERGQGRPRVPATAIVTPGVRLDPWRPGSQGSETIPLLALCVDVCVIT